MSAPALDRIDLAILKALLEDARRSHVELSSCVPLSPTAVARRLRALEEQGLIDGYRADLNLARLGLGVTIVVKITLKEQNADSYAAFEAAVVTRPAVIACLFMSGSDDYVLHVKARDMQDYESIHKTQLLTLPGVAHIQSNFVMREVLRRAAPLSAVSAERLEASAGPSPLR
ncbi:MAG TPA: Lrp/AsnC family transcriptional regulator [Azospirillaceae bacterium]|nr:Lrp/AsnC family transcriptional regulator [Azospirillaceae bacterium]